MTVAVTIVISAVISLTLTPMMCARMLKSKHEERRPDFFDRINPMAMVNAISVKLFREKPSA
jgi:multidrug efflux pump subunit AcrB